MVGTPNSEWFPQTQYGWQMKNMDGTPKQEWIPDNEYGCLVNKYG